MFFVPFAGAAPVYLYEDGTTGGPVNLEDFSATQPASTPPAVQNAPVAAPLPVPVVVDCVKTFAQAQTCPSEQCDYGCFTPTDDGCQMACLPKPCWSIAPSYCPSDRCQLMVSCENSAVCFPKQPKLPAGSCGDIGYNGQDVPCCKGLIKRCGLEFFDGTCDMAGRRSVYAVPVCVPCGNGICNQFEQSCNCPEDCSRYGE